MGRKRGKPVYAKSKPTSCIVSLDAWQKLKAAERRTGKSRSDVINHCLLSEADNITRETFDKLAQQRKANEAMAAVR